MGAPRWDERDATFAKALQKEIGVDEAGLSSEVVAYAPGHGSSASSDIGEVSAAAPLSELFVATAPIGTPSHQWGWAACAAHPLGFKGMLVAAKVLGASMTDLLHDPATIAAAKAEFARSTKGKPYASPLPPDAKPTPF